MTMTKKEAAEMLAKAGIPKPENWSKMTTERAAAWAEAAFATTHEKAPEKAPKKGLLSRAKDAAKAALGLDKAARKNAEMKVFSDPKYRRTTRKMRRFMSRHRGVNYAADPVPMTRQVARRKALNVGLKASDFRRFMVA